MRRGETQESMLSPADLVNGDPVDAARVAAAPSGAPRVPSGRPADDPHGGRVRPHRIRRAREDDLPALDHVETNNELKHIINIRFNKKNNITTLNNLNKA